MTGEEKTYEPIPKDILKIWFEERLLELDARIQALKGTDKRYSLDMKNLKDTYNINLKLARQGGLLDDDDHRLYK